MSKSTTTLLYYIREQKKTEFLLLLLLQDETICKCPPQRSEKKKKILPTKILENDFYFWKNPKQKKGIKIIHLKLSSEWKLKTIHFETDTYLPYQQLAFTDFNNYSSSSLFQFVSSSSSSDHRILTFINMLW